MATYDRPASITPKAAGAMAPSGLAARTNKSAWDDVQRTTLNRIHGPSTDPTHSNWQEKFLLDKSCRILFGRVVDAIAYANVYKVQLEKFGPTSWATPLVHTGLQPMGVKQICNIPINSKVLLLEHPVETTLYIIGCLPSVQTSSDSAMADFISQQGRAGLLVDSVHSFPFSLASNGLIPDLSAGRPFDSTTEGQTGYIAESGLMNYLDSFFAAIRVDEETGAWFFYHDQLARIAGHNLQLWSAAAERFDMDDQGELSSEQGYAPYYHETLGAYEFSTIVSKDNDASYWQYDKDGQCYSAVEPCDDAQTGLWRLREFRGYLGQAEKKILSLPPQAPCYSIPPLGDSCSSDSLFLANVSTVLPGVYEESLALTGRKVIRSAHEIILSKQLALPTPKRVKFAEDPEGDNPTNYKFASLQGSGPDHIVNGEISVTGTDNPVLVRAAGFLDTQAFSFEWIGNHPFFYHTYDYYIPNESALHYLNPADCTTPIMAPPAFASLACQQYLEEPVPIPLKVDHRYNDVNYYPNSSHFAMSADGSIIISDGFGAEIKLSAGNIELTSAGDICLRPGRNVVMMSGYDTIIRAKNCVDISATDHDVRIKAERNLWLVGAGECGGVLIESKATAAACDFITNPEDPILGGVTIKAPQSILSMCAANICNTLQTVAGQETEQVLTFDVGWAGKLRFKGKYIENFIQEDGGILDFWVNDGDGSVVTANEKWKDSITFCQNTRIGGKVLIGDCLTASGNVYSMGRFASASGLADGGVVYNIPDTSAISTELTALSTRCTSTLPAIGEEELIVLAERQDTFCCCDATFTFRTSDYYRTTNFILFESRWQQIARMSGATVGSWVEKGIANTYPYPGKDKWVDESTYRTLDLTLYDPSTGLAADRGVAYQNPAFALPASVIPNASYLVIV